MLKLIEKLKDFNDTKVYQVVLMEDLESLSVLTDSIIACGRDRFEYEVYKNEITAYMMEMSMPYNRYLELMQNLREQGWTLTQETKVGIFSRMVKAEKDES